MTLALAIGKFDALHLGHRALVERAAAMGQPALLSFTGMAEALGWPARAPLVAASDRARILGQWQPAAGQPIAELQLPFAAVQPLTPLEFLTLVRERLGAGAVVVGEDFRFGRGRSGGVVELRQLAGGLGLAVAVVPPVLNHEVPVSSSRVRDALATGDCATAAALLGREHRVVGTVVRGDGRGRTIGVPTANCGARENLEPASGVYAAWAGLAGGTRGGYAAAVNVGHVPTAGERRALTVEAHLITYHGECYGQRLTLDFVARVRDERRFANLDALRKQIVKDIEACGHLLLPRA